VESLETQVQRCWEAFCALRGNLVLFHRFLADHLEAALPVIYTPTVGAVI
jgi:malate dehydrogenase (oxaloacetate-decarboxylating)